MLAALRTSDAYAAGASEWQEEFVQAILRCGYWEGLPLAYRRKLLKRVVAAVGAGDEINAELLHAHLHNADDAEPGWSERTFLPAAAPPLRLRVSDSIGGGSETGGCVWDAAIGLSAHLLDEETGTGLGPGAGASSCSWKREGAATTVVELGAGPGLPGLLLAHRASSVERVVLTDLFPATIDNLHANVSALAPDAAARVTVEYLDWCDDAHANAARLAAAPDLILAADVVYEPHLAEPLLTTLHALLLRGGTTSVALLAAERRGDAWDHFDRCLRRRVAAGGLCCKEISEEMQRALRRPTCRFWCAPDTIERLILLEIRLAREVDGDDAASRSSSSSNSMAATSRADNAAGACADHSTGWHVHLAVRAGCDGASVLPLRMTVRHTW